MFVILTDPFKNIVPGLYTRLEKIFPYIALFSF